MLLLVSSSGPEASLTWPIRFNCIANAVYNVVEWDEKNHWEATESAEKPVSEPHRNKFYVLTRLCAGKHFRRNIGGKKERVIPQRRSHEAAILTPLN